MIANAAVSSGVTPTVASSTLTVTSSVPFVSKSSAAFAFRKSSNPSISKRPASAPVSARVSVPRASSVTTMSATLVRLVTSAPSDRLVIVLFSATVGASFTSVSVIASAAVSSGVTPTVASSTLTVTCRVPFVSKSSAAFAFRNSSNPSISKSAASAPVSVRVSVPKASSVTTMSATFVRLVTSAPSDRLVTALFSATVGASFASVSVIANAAVSSGVTPTVVSSTLTVTSRVPFVSKSSAAFARRKSSNPSISKSAASAPVSARVSVSSASSVTTMSATFVRLVTSAPSDRLVTVLFSATVGASFTSVSVIWKAAASSGLPAISGSSTVTLTSSVGLASKSSATFARKNSSFPSISNKAASGPLRPVVLVPSPSSVTTISATLIRVDVS